MSNFKNFNLSRLPPAIAEKNKQAIQEVMNSKKQKPNKYQNTKVNVAGEAYDSKKEVKRHGQLKLLLQAGEILFIARQVEFLITIEGQKLCSYYADFVYIQLPSRSLVVEDCKSPATRNLPAYRIKKKALFLQHEITIKEI